MKIIVTGASGFVGQNLTKHMEDQKLGEVQALSLRTRLPQNLKGDVLIHLAGKAHDIKDTSDVSEYFYVNEQLTKEIFDLFLQSDVRDFIFMSSVKAIADTVEGVLYEDSPEAPLTAYGQSKYRAEQYLLSKSLPAGKRLLILRPCMIHGPGNKGNLNLLYQLVNKGIPYPLGAFNNQRSFLSVDNLCFIIEKIITQPLLPGGIYQLADDQALSTTELIQIIGKASGKTPRIWNFPKNIIKSFAKLGDRLHLPLNTDRLKKLTDNYVISNAKIKDLINVTHMPVSAEEGLTKTIKSFCNR